MDKQTLVLKKLAQHGIVVHDISQPVYKYVSIDTAKLILENQTLKYSTPIELNDNDLPVEFIAPQIKEKKKNKRILENIINSPYGLGRKAKKRWAKQYDASEYTNFFKEAYEKHRHTTGIFCSTPIKDNLLMWDKYADKSKGACIEFVFTEQFLGNKNDMFHVAYPDRLLINPLDKQGREDVASTMRWLFSKHKQYEFEREVRISSLIRVGVVPIKTYFNDIVKGIYFGTETTDQDIKDIEDIIANNNYSMVNYGRIKMKNEAP